MNPSGTSPSPLDTLIPPSFQFSFYVKTPDKTGLMGQTRVSEEAGLTQSNVFFWKDGITKAS